MAALWKRIYEDRWAYFFILPSCLVFAVMVAVPLLQAFKLSFYEADLVNRVWVGLGNYRRLFADPIFRTEVRNTILLVAGVVPSTVVLALFIAVIASSLGRKAETFIRMAFYIPTVASSVILSLIWLWILNPVIGLANWVLNVFGLPPQTWLADPRLALISVAVVVITFTLGQPIILFMAGLGGIPEDLYDAAKIDGASPWQEFWRITLPLLKSTTLFVLVTRTIGIFQVFAVILLLTRGGPAYATETIVYRIYELAFDLAKYGYASTQGVVLLVMIMIVTLIQFRITGTTVEL